MSKWTWGLNATDGNFKENLSKATEIKLPHQPSAADHQSLPDTSGFHSATWSFQCYRQSCYTSVTLSVTQRFCTWKGRAESHKESLGFKTSPFSTSLELAFFKLDCLAFGHKQILKTGWLKASHGCPFSLKIPGFIFLFSPTSYTCSNSEGALIPSNHFITTGKDFYPCYQDKSILR